MDCIVHGTLQARILEWVAFPFSRGSSQPRDRTQVSHIAGGIFTNWATREAQEYWSGWPIPSPGNLSNPGIEPRSPSLQADSLPNELWGILLLSSVAQLCPTLCDPMNCSTPGFPVYPQLPELAQTQVHWVGNVIQPSHPLLAPSLPTFNHSQHQGLFKWVHPLHQVTKILEFQLKNQSFQWLFRTDLL